MATFAAGEAVLCFFGSQLYDAKIQETGQDSDGKEKYLIHYSGWNKSWDEWLPESSILKLNDENLKRQRKLAKTYSKWKKEKRKAAKEEKLKQEDRGSPPPPPPQGVKRQYLTKRRRMELASQATQKKMLALKPLSALPIPAALLVRLAADRENVTKYNKVVHLPRTPSIAEILDQYCQYAQANVQIKDIVAEVASGLKVYFQTVLGSMLLYQQERLQWQQHRDDAPDADLNERYGAEHLLRLFVKLPALLHPLPLEPKVLHSLVLCFTDILNFINQNSDVFFSPHAYINVSGEYIRQSSRYEITS